MPYRVKVSLMRFLKASRLFALLFLQSSSRLVCTFIAVSRFVHAQSAPELLAQADKLADQGNWFRAGPLYARAEAGFHKRGDTRNELYARFGRLHRNVEEGSYRAVRIEAARLLAEPTVENDSQLRIRGLALLGAIDLNLDTAAALDDWTQVRAIAAKSGDQKWENRASGQLGLLAGVGGNISAAGLALYGALAKAEQLKDSAAYIYFASWLANGMAIHGMADRATSVLDKADVIARNNGYTEVPLQLTIARIRALINLPEAKRDGGVTEAAKLVPLALAQAQREQIVGAQTELLNAAGQIAVARNDLSGAEKAYRQAVEVSAAAWLPRQEGEACLNLSRFYRTAKQPQKASAVIDQGIRAVQRVEEAYDLPVFVAEKAEVQASLGSVRAADATFQTATDLVEGLLVNAPTSQVKSGMIAAWSGIYLDHFRLAWNQLHNAPYAFAIIERARGRALFDSIRYARQTNGVTATPTRAEAEITRLQRSLMHDRLTGSDTKRSLDLLERAYMQINPLEVAQQRQEMRLLARRPVKVEAVQSQLSPRQCLVEYVLDERGSYAIEITRQDITIHALPPRSQISKLSRSLVTAIRSGGESRGSAKELYSLLVAPILHTDTDSLIVIPDGPLHLVPFSALVDESGAYLVERITLSAAPSATIYKLLSSTRETRRATKPFLGVAFSPSDQSAAPSASATRGIAALRSGTLAPLRFGREEITEAAKTFGPDSVTLDGTQASEQSLKAQPLGDFRVIHLAAHGVSDEMEPDRAALVLAPGNATEDGLWQSREIVRSRLNADTVVLSACETGSGRLQGQEGVMNLARAFLIAGSRSVVASLWAVDDRSTATLMESFYIHLKAGLTVSEALRAAQRDFIKDYGEKAKPNLWAGFEVIGYGAKRFASQIGTNPQAAR